MYLHSAAVLAQHGLNADGEGVGPLLKHADGYGWLDNVLESIWDFLGDIAATLSSWFTWLGPPIAWTFHVVYVVVAFVQSHPHPFHILGWTIFFGPIILLLPALLLLEMLILVLLYSTFLFHGFHTGTYPLFSWRSTNNTTLQCCVANTLLTHLLSSLTEPLETRFEILKDRFIDWRESLFATVEIWTAYVNRWTTDYAVLLVLRVLAGAMSSYLLVDIWTSGSSMAMP